MSLSSPQTDAEDAEMLRAVARGDESAFAREREKLALDPPRRDRRGKPARS